MFSLFQKVVFFGDLPESGNKFLLFTISRLRLHEEMDCYVKALSYLLKCQTFDELFWPLERSGFEIAVRITDGFLNMSKRVKEECLLESK